MSTNKPSSPLVSVYMPTHNRAALVKAAIESVQKQTYPHLEIIICDDGSSDETASVIADMQRRDARIIYLRNETPMGACHARNRCIAIAQGEFITGLDDDDAFLENRIEQFVTTAHALNKPFLCANMIFKNNRFARPWQRYQGDITLEMMSYKNCIGNQVFVKTKMMQDIGGFDTRFPAWQDYDLWFRMIQRYGSCYRLSEPTYIVNIEEDRPRITSGSKAWQGYQQFITVHRAYLQRRHLNALYFQDKLNRTEAMTLTDLIRYPGLRNCLVFSKFHLKRLMGYH